jgi:2Fe-2S ferredoxin
MKIHMPQLSKTLECEAGANLFRFLRENQVALASSCKGDGICGKCVVQIVQGMENLSISTNLEDKLHAKYNLKPDQRIACQTRVLGNIEIRTTYW